ncbi:MAG: transposase [Acidobacteriota bacterium]|nr:transposase [Acidobacteriota bacterium]
MAEACTTRYRARNPRATPLYRLFDTHFDEVKGQWEECFERHCGFWRSFVDELLAELLFRHKVIRLLQVEGLLTQERTELLLSWRHTGFSVHNRVRVDPEDRPAVERLARYIMRPPISLDRMAWDGVGEVQYRRKVGHECSGPPVGWLDGRSAIGRGAGEGGGSEVVKGGSEKG